MKITMTLEGARKVNRAIAALDRVAGGRVRDAVKTSAYAIRDRAKKNAPVGTESHNHPPGQLRDAITAEMIADTLSGRAGVPKESPAAAYAPIVEWGDRGRNKTAEPYLWPAAEAERRHHIARVQAAIRESVQLVRAR